MPMTSEQATRWRAERWRARASEYGVSVRRIKLMRQKYASHKASAKVRGIEFVLTFRQWFDIWQASGKWDQRGSRSQDYVMARKKDRGAYSVDNVRVITKRQNQIEGFDHGRSDRFRLARLRQDRSSL